MPSDHSGVREQTIAADHTIVSDVTARHEQVAITDSCCPGSGADAHRHSTVNRDMLSKRVPVADLDGGGFTFVAEVLGSAAQHRSRPHVVVLPQSQRPDEMDVRTNHAVCPDDNVALDHDERSHPDVFTEFRGR
jgi:hypothetical protein